MSLQALRRTLWVWLLLPACARSTPGSADAAAPADGAGAIDAGGDAAVAQAPSPGAELVTASGQVRAGSRTMDVEVGHALEQRALSAGTRRLVGGAVVYP